MTMPPPEVCLRIRQLHALIGSPIPPEAEAARQKLAELLKEHHCSWNDLPEILAADTPTTKTADDTTSPPHADNPVDAAVAEAEARNFNLFDMIIALLERYVWINSEHVRTVVALCLLQAWVFDRFEHTPRVVVLAPRDGCGKSTLLKKFARLLLPQFFYSGNASAASIYDHLRYHPGCPLIIDEGDNLEIEGVLLAVFNEGYEYGGTITRHKRTYDVYGPLFLGNRHHVGSTAPAPILCDPQAETAPQHHAPAAHLEESFS